MKTRIAKLSGMIVAVLLALPVSAANGSDATQALLEEYRNRGASQFDAQAGKQLWVQDVKGRSCTSCHSASAREGGKHLRTGKLIQPMAPLLNSQRLTDGDKIEKWFLRNCRWTFARECTPQEKGNVLVWLSQQ